MQHYYQSTEFSSVQETHSSTAQTTKCRTRIQNHYTTHVSLKASNLGALSAKLHGYGYVYRYRKDMDTRIRQFLKKPDTQIRLLFKK